MIFDAFLSEIGTIEVLNVNAADTRTEHAPAMASSAANHRIRYNVFVDELRDGGPYRGKAYLGGYGEKWIDQFAVRASADFPQAWTAP